VTPELLSNVMYGRLESSSFLPGALDANGRPLPETHKAHAHATCSDIANHVIGFVHQFTQTFYPLRIHPIYFHAFIVHSCIIYPVSRFREGRTMNGWDEAGRISRLCAGRAEVSLSRGDSWAGRIADA